MKLGLLNVRPYYEDSTVPIFLPNGCDYLASFISHNKPGWETFVEYDARRLLEKKPDIIGISSFTRTFTNARNIAREFKKYTKAPVIIGGHHITALPEKLDWSMDIGVVGEGENTLLDLVNLYEQGGLSPENLNNIDGLVFRDREGKLVRTRSRGLINDLDILPFPYRTKVPGVSGYWQESIFTSRGCPFRCKYCAINEFWDKIRYHSPARVIAELEDLIATTGVKSITIHDDLFGINKKRLKELVTAIRENGIHKKVSFACNARASVFDDEICRLFLDMNVKAVVFGMESANDRILSYMKGSTSARQNQTALDLCKKYNILGIPNFIFGFPTETQAEAADSYWFVKRNFDRLADFRVFPATPLPGTYLYDHCVSKKLITDNFDDWEALDLYFLPERSVYMNDAYTISDYQHILEQMKQLSQQKKPFNRHLEEVNQAGLYNNNLNNQIVSFNLERNKKVLEISKVDYLIGQLFAGEYLTAPVKNGRLELPGETDRFDYIFITHALETLRNPMEELVKVKNRLSENGKIILSLYNAGHPLFVARLLLQDNLYDSWGLYSPENINYFSENDFYRLTAQAGLVVKDIKTIVSGPVNNSYNELLSFLKANLPPGSFSKITDIFSNIVILELKKEGNIFT